VSWAPLFKLFTPSPALFKTDTKAELQKETSLKIKGWALVYQVNVIQKTSGFGCMVIRKAVGITEMTIVSGLRIIDSNAQTGITWWNWTLRYWSSSIGRGRHGNCRLNLF
jgi:hypothetical protein